MSQKEAIYRHHFIIQQLRRKPSTLTEISSFLERASELDHLNYRISSRTFQRDVADILSIYGLEIIYDKKRKVYVLEESAPNFNNQQTVFDALAIMHALQLTNGYADIIQYEDRNPKGAEHLSGLIHSIKNKLQVKFTYQRFWENQVSERVIEPYFLKQFEFRWYIIGWDKVHNNIRTFGLDRISNLEILLDKTVVNKHKEAQQIFQDCYGIITPTDKQPEEIILRFETEQGKYLKSMPLHHSQQIIEDNEEELKIRLYLCITDDFIMKLLSYGDEICVLQPQSLITSIKTVFENGAKLYT